MCLLEYNLDISTKNLPIFSPRIENMITKPSASRTKTFQKEPLVLLLFFFALAFRVVRQMVNHLGVILK